MSVLDELLARAGGRRVVAVVCPETLRGAVPAGVVVVAVPGARVLRADGEVARAVALAAAEAGGADVVVVAHEDCAFRAPSFGLPGAPPPGEGFATARDLARHSVAQLRASPWIGRSAVSGLVADAAGGVTGAGEAGPAPSGTGTPGAAPTSGYVPGPVSLFGGSGTAGPSLGAAPPVQPGPVRWESPPPMAATEAVLVAPPAPVALPPAPPPPPRRDVPRTEEPAPAPSSDDPFARAEQILDRLRRERRR